MLAYIYTHTHARSTHPPVQVTVTVMGNSNCTLRPLLLKANSTLGVPVLGTFAMGEWWASSDKGVGVVMVMVVGK